LKNNIDSWSLNSNPNNIISEYTLTIIDHIPFFKLILYTCYYIILIVCIISILENNRIKSLFFPTALLMLTIGTIITCNMLSFEDYTDLWLLIIHHPISLETKQYYLMMQLESIIRFNYTPEIYMKPDLFQWILDELSPKVLNTDWEIFKQKSPSEITQYACELLNLESPKNPYVIQVIQSIIALVMIEQFLF
jgi:hypothetical protein